MHVYMEKKELVSSKTQTKFRGLTEFEKKISFQLLPSIIVLLGHSYIQLPQFFYLFVPGIFVTFLCEMNSSNYCITVIFQQYLWICIIGDRFMVF